MLSPEGAGIRLDKDGCIQVNGQLETTVPGIYALGDVRCASFHHTSYDDFRILRTNLLEQGSANTRDRLVPYTIFIDPQLDWLALSRK